MSHRNAPLSELGRLKLARFHVESGSTIRGTAERFQVSTTTVIRWTRRFRAVQAAGRHPTAADMADASSRPHRCPTRTHRRTDAPTHRRTEQKVKHLRTTRRLGPVQIAGRVGIPASTVHPILVREGMNRLDHMDRATGQVIRYERANPGDLVHVDVKKFGRIPTGGGWKVHGRGFTGSDKATRANAAQRADRGTGKVGYAYVHSALDDHSRLTYSEVHDDETAATTTGFWPRAVGFFAAHGITVREVLTDNGPAYRSRDWAHLTADQGIRHRRTLPTDPRPTARSSASTAPCATNGATARPTPAKQPDAKP